ncbi:hypothetical protein THAOC_37580 [Thalassiosira oceanica]|uniref:Uncharacterized protein n=1 Tax=Thalassiosira oceanica TaxID=159749 RepID=K0QYL6_THAOC|nr:hypothetical protein THAOC_37580 [Thalassiosira oceanica]|eukprot:EJK43930.1 hypothetical protein THAOC_37580 [Thalassiosira oceanica]
MMTTYFKDFRGAVCGVYNKVEANSAFECWTTGSGAAAGGATIPVYDHAARPLCFAFAKAGPSGTCLCVALPYDHAARPIVYLTSAYLCASQKRGRTGPAFRVEARTESVRAAPRSSRTRDRIGEEVYASEQDFYAMDPHQEEARRMQGRERKEEEAERECDSSGQPKKRGEKLEQWILR